MTLQEVKELEDGQHEHGFRAAIQDMAERFGPEKLREILDNELRILGLEIVNYAR